MSAALLHEMGLRGWQADPSDAGWLRRGPVTVMLGFTALRTELRLIDLPPQARGAGLAGAALDDLVASADAAGERLVLTVSPMGRRGLPAAALSAAYARRGFAPCGRAAGGEMMMARAPAPGVAAAAPGA